MRETEAVTCSPTAVAGRWHRAVWGAALFFVLPGMTPLVCPVLASAQSENRAGAQDADSQADRARSLFEEGLAAADNDDWQTAADRFRRSLSLRTSSVVAYNLGSALREQGKLVEAAEVFRGVVADGEARAAIRRAADELIAAIEPRLGSLTLDVNAPGHERVPEDIAVRVADRWWPRDRWGVAVPIDPGLSEVTARRADRVLVRQMISVDPGEQIRVNMTVHLPPPVPTPADTAMSGVSSEAQENGYAEGSSWLTSPWFWLVMGTTVVAGVVVALAFTLGGDDEPVSGTLNPPVVEF